MCRGYDFLLRGESAKTKAAAFLHRRTLRALLLVSVALAGPGAAGQPKISAAPANANAAAKPIRFQVLASFQRQKTSPCTHDDSTRRRCDGCRETCTISLSGWGAARKVAEDQYEATLTPLIVYTRDWTCPIDGQIDRETYDGKVALLSPEQAAEKAAALLSPSGLAPAGAAPSGSVSLDLPVWGFHFSLMGDRGTLPELQEAIKHRGDRQWMLQVIASYPTQRKSTKAIWHREIALGLLCDAAANEQPSLGSLSGEIPATMDSKIVLRAWNVGSQKGLREENMDSDEGKWSCDLKWSIGGPDESPLELVLVPGANFKTWTPVAATKPGQVGDQLLFTAELRHCDTGELSHEKTAKFEVELHDTSKEPGSCMNSPWTDTEPDFKLLPEENPAFRTVGKDGQSAETKPGQKACRFSLTCYDGGAYTKLKVKARIDGEDKVLTAKYEGLEEVPVPYDLNENHIADCWEKEFGVYGKAASEDADEEPPGDRHHGDGLTIWEEYRGFLENGKHIRTNPRKKDFFVCDTVGGSVQAGIEKLAELTGLEVHGRLTLDELSPARVINRNHQAAAHVVDQHGILIDSWSGQDCSMSMGGPGTPKSVTRVCIDATLAETETGISASGVPRNFTVRVRTVAHELLHSLNVWHHGEGDMEVFWRLATVRGRTEIFEYTSKEDADSGEKGAPIKVLLEDGSPFPATRLVWGVSHPIELGMPAGEHSGCVDCVMRYIVADGYAAGGGTRYYVLSEPRGEGICSSHIGTGVNAQDHKPRSRYGDAAEGRGDCVERFCVNDLFH